MKIYWKHISEDIRVQYNLQELLSNDYIYVKIKKGMYGLKQASILAWDNFVSNLSKHAYHPIKHTTGMWEHETRRTKFCLCVDDFGIKSFSDADNNHLLDSLNQNYTVTVDHQGTNFCVINIYCNYKEGYADISMPHYIRYLSKKL